MDPQMIMQFLQEVRRDGPQGQGGMPSMLLLEAFLPYMPPEKQHYFGTILHLWRKCAEINDILAELSGRGAML